MRPDGVEVTPPTLDDNLGVSQGVKDLVIEEFVPHPLVAANLAAGSCSRSAKED